MAGSFIQDPLGLLGIAFLASLAAYILIRLLTHRHKAS
jgi:hypothetical protein